MHFILTAAGCFTICSLADKYSVSKARLDGKTITWIMAFATSVFLALLLPFSGIDFKPLSWGLLIFSALAAVDKFFEFVLSAKVLVQMSAFELKAWLGLTLFISYFTDAVMYNSNWSVKGIVFLAVTLAGLFLIAKSNSKAVEYKKIIIPLILYILVKFGYGFIVKAGEQYAPNIETLFVALIILTIVLFPFVKITNQLKTNKKGILVTAITKLPNAVGLIAEGFAITVSLTGFSLIQPIILVALFLIGVIRKEGGGKMGLLGSVVSILGIAGFAILS